MNQATRSSGSTILLGLFVSALLAACSGTVELEQTGSQSSTDTDEGRLTPPSPGAAVASPPAPASLGDGGAGGGSIGGDAGAGGDDGGTCEPCVEPRICCNADQSECVGNSGPAATCCDAGFTCIDGEH